MSEKPRIIIIYNADASVLGKLSYGYKKLFPAKNKGATRESSDQGPVCGNCDITHGGLSLSETAAWSSTKESLERELDVRIEQRHRDELDQDTRAFTKAHNIRFPTILYVSAPSTAIQVLVDRADVNACALIPKTASSPEQARADALAQRLRVALKDMPDRKVVSSTGHANL